MDGKKLDDAIKSLGESLVAALWTDETHVDRQRGEVVFEKEKETVGPIEESERLPGQVDFWRSSPTSTESVRPCRSFRLSPPVEQRKGAEHILVEALL